MTREQVAQALYTAEFGPKGFPGPNSKFWAMADAILALSPPEPTEGQIEAALRAFYKHTAVQNFPQASKDQMEAALIAARAMPLQDGAVTQDKHHD